MKWEMGERGEYLKIAIHRNSITYLNWYSLWYNKIKNCVSRLSAEEPFTLQTLHSELINSPGVGSL